MTHNHAVDIFLEFVKAKNFVAIKRLNLQPDEEAKYNADLDSTEYACVIDGIVDYHALASRREAEELLLESHAIIGKPLNTDTMVYLNDKNEPIKQTFWQKSKRYFSNFLKVMQTNPFQPNHLLAGNYFKINKIILASQILWLFMFGLLFSIFLTIGYFLNIQTLLVFLGLYGAFFFAIYFAKLTLNIFTPLTIKLTQRLK